MVPVLVQLGPISLYSFGAMLALGFLAGSVVVAKGLEARGLDRRHATSIVWWAAIGGIAGSRILSLANDWRAFLESPVDFVISGAGFVWYGGLVGGLLGVLGYVLLQRLPWWQVADTTCVGVVLGQAIGRVGCQLSGDGDWGTETTLPWGMAYTRAIFGWDHAPGVLVHPAPVYESLLYSGIFLLLLRLAREPSRHADGTVFFTYLVLSGIARFLIETVRIEPRLWLGFTEAQWFGMASVAGGLLGLAWVTRRRPAAAVAAVLLAIGLGACSSGSKQAPDFVVQDLSGQAVRLSAQRGKVVFLNVWATWCAPCREEMPSLEALSRKLGATDFVVLAVSEDDGGAPVVKKFAEEMNLTFPLLVDPRGDVGRQYGITGYPESFLIDREGRQVARFIGPRDWRDPAIERDLRTLIDEGRWVRGPDGNPRG